MELQEREEALNKLEAALQKAVAGNGRFALVSGEAGIGKTAVVTKFAGQESVRVLWGSCDALFTPRPLGPLYDIAGQTAGELAALLQGQIDRPALFSACRRELHTPTLMIIEDIHWADEATLDLLKYLGRRIQTTRSLLIVTFRDDALGAQHPLRLLLGDLARSVGVQRITLSPLSETAVRHLAGVQRIDAKTLHQQTGGNPFFVTEVLAAGEAGIPGTVRDAVLARVARLSKPGRSVLNAAAVIGQRIEPWLLEAIVGEEITAVSETLERGILLAQEDGFTFRHELARQTILDEILPHQRKFLHQAALNALRAPSSIKQKDAARLAHHAVGANDQDAILTFARQAGVEAAQLGMHRAAKTWFEQVLPLADKLSPDDELELYDNYALHNQSFDLHKSLIAFAKVRQLAKQNDLPAREGQALVNMAIVHYRLSELEACDRLLQQALTILEPLPPDQALIAAYSLMSMRHLLQGDAKIALASAEKGYKLALKQEKVGGIVQAYQVFGLCTMPIDYKQGIYHLEQCLAMALQHDQFRAAGTVYSNLIMHKLDVYETEQAAALMQKALAFIREHEMDFNLNMTRAWEAMLCFYQGRWAESAAIATEVLQLTSAPISCIPALVARGRLLTRSGNLDKARLALDEAGTLSKQVNNQQRIGIYYCAMAELAWFNQDYEHLREIIAEFYETAVQNKLPGFAAEMAYWRWRLGKTVETFAWMVEPFVLEINGNWQAAAAAWDALGCPYEQARALASGDTAAQKAALLIFEQLGAKPMLDQVRQTLQQAGTQKIPRGPRATTKENPFKLTNRQLQVLQLLTEALTNAEIADRLHISPKTVDHHVSAVLGKLQVSSREEAAEIGRQIDR